MLTDMKIQTEALADEMMELVKDLYDHPEIGNEEFRSMGVLCDKCRLLGFEVSEGYVVPTGWIAKYDSKKPGPTIAYLCEFDALPEVGHGCGHNLIAGIGITAGAALKSKIDELGGQIWIIGTPAEENFGGKVSMAEAGVFDNVNVAMMLHPSDENGLGGRTNAIYPLKFEFFGKNAHGCHPRDGKSALDAAVLSYVNINFMRQFAPANSFIHGIIRNGGEAANVIPAYASLEYYFRAATMKEAKAMGEQAIQCVEGACKACGTTYETSVYECPYEDNVINYTLADCLKDKYSELGLEATPVDEVPGGSSDIGSVSYRCPALHGYIKICGQEAAGHSKERADATISPMGRAALINGAASLASIGEDCISQPDLLAKIKAEFKASIQ